MTQANEVLFEVEDNFQKQTYRTRCYIYGANGRQILNIPVLKSNSKQATKDVQIDQTEQWQAQHLKSIVAAYSSSPFYEFFDSELDLLFASKDKFLLDFNLKCHEFIVEHAQLEFNGYKKTAAFVRPGETDGDFRFLADAKAKRSFEFAPYIQVFSDKHGFIENLSILDLLFMEGPNTTLYLEQQQLNF